MKKIALLALAVIMLAVFCGCGLGGVIDDLDDIGGGDNNDTPGEKLEYTEESVTEWLQQLRDNGGYLIEIEVTSFEGGGETEKSTFAMGADGNKHYFKGENGNETIYHVGEDSYSFYERYGGNEGWDKATINYSEYFDKEMAEQTIGFSQLTLMFLLTNYTAYSGSDFTKLGGAMVAGKSCTKYKYSIELLTFKFEATYYIENVSGMCLKYEVSAEAQGESGASTFECKRYLAPYTIEIPTDINEG